MDRTEHRFRRNDYRKRGDRAWALIQARYLAGESAPRLAEAFKVTEYAIRARIWREGWSKASLAEAEDAALPDPGEAPPEIAAAAEGDTAARLEPRAAARLALDTAARLMREGKMTGAAEAARVADVMARAAARLDGGAPEDPGEPDEAAFEAVRRKVLGLPRPIEEERCAAATPPPPFGWSRSPQGREETV